MSYGHLKIFCGPMFAGKTTHLLDEIKRFGPQKKIIIKPSFDTRYSKDEIVSHDGEKTPAYSITEWSQVSHLIPKVNVIFFDEIQFFIQPHFKDDLIAIVKDLLSHSKYVIGAGLDNDWLGSPFHTTAYLLAMADEVHKLTAFCTICSRPANKNHKLIKNNKSIELGEKDLYEARCNFHWGKDD